jgi:hypothetical protein
MTISNMADTTRVKRLAAVKAGVKIQGVLEWECMSRHHPTYMAVEDAINAEFEREVKPKKATMDGEPPNAAIEYDVMSDSSEESTGDVSDDGVYEPCADSVDSADEEDIRSESSLCSSGVESLPKDQDDSDTSLVDFSAAGGSSDDDTEDDAYMYDEDDVDLEEQQPMLQDESASAVVGPPQEMYDENDVDLEEQQPMLQDESASAVVGPPQEMYDENDVDLEEQQPMLQDESASAVVGPPQEISVDFWPDTVFNSHAIDALATDAQQASDELLSTVLLCDVVSAAECMLTQHTAYDQVGRQPDAAQEQDDPGAEVLDLE